MTEAQQWSPPDWARLLAYLMGLGIFAWQATRPAPNFPVIMVTALVLIGLSERVFRQVKEMVLGIFGRSPQPPPPTTGSE